MQRQPRILSRSMAKSITVSFPRSASLFLSPALSDAKNLEACSISIPSEVAYSNPDSNGHCYHNDHNGNRARLVDHGFLPPFCETSMLACR